MDNLYVRAQRLDGKPVINSMYVYRPNSQLGRLITRCAQAANITIDQAREVYNEIIKIDGERYEQR